MRLRVSELDPALVPVGPLEAVVVGHPRHPRPVRSARLLVLVRAPSEIDRTSYFALHVSVIFSWRTHQKIALCNEDQI